MPRRLRTAVPAIESIRLSNMSWRTSRHLLAPSAARMPTSRSRAVALASSRFATFAQAMSRTMPTAPSSINIHVRVREPTMWSTSGRTPMWLSLFQSGFAFSSAAGHLVHLRLRPSDRDARLESGDHLEIVASRGRIAHVLIRGHDVRNPDVGAVKSADRIREFGRHDSEDLVSTLATFDIIEQYRAADDLRIPAEAASPQSIAQHHDAVASRHLVLRREGTADGRPDAQHVEKRGGHTLAGPGTAARRPVRAASASRSQSRPSTRTPAAPPPSRCSFEAPRSTVRPAHVCRQTCAWLDTARRPLPGDRARQTAVREGSPRRRRRRSPCSRRSQASARPAPPPKSSRTNGGTERRP